MKNVLLTLSLALCYGATALADGKKGNDEEKFIEKSQTSFDFSETLIEGKFKAPQGFFLQGRQSQSLSQMVRLRSNFRNELRNSKSSVKSVVK